MITDDLRKSQGRIKKPRHGLMLVMNKNMHFILSSIEKLVHIVPKG